MTPQPSTVAGLREALELAVNVFGDGRGTHHPTGFCNLTEEGHQAIEKAHAALAAEAASSAAPELDVERLVRALDEGNLEGTLLVTAYRYPDGRTDEGIALTHRGLVNELAARLASQSSGTFDE